MPKNGALFSFLSYQIPFKMSKISPPIDFHFL